MDFAFTEEQADLRMVVRGFLSQHPVRSREPGSFDTALWRRLSVELGLTGLATDPSFGVELAVVLEETGRALLALPYLSTVVAARFLPGYDGEAVATLALGDGLVVRAGAITGTVDGVLDGDVASVAVASAEGALYAVPLAGVLRTPVASLDLSRPTATLTFTGQPATLLPSTPDQARDALHLALAVESLGVAAASLETTIDHLKTRQQFGVALATFQALRHRVADLAVALEGATSTTWYAVRADASEWPVIAPMAKLVAADAAWTVTAESIQLLGGIGFTWEHDAHRYFKRATVTRLTPDDPVTLRRTLAQRAGIL